ncbi:LacI family DNA-binding transcriptional regulator [Lactobacillaceae bacterium 24-114]
MVTIKDIAKRANVSISTTSRALNNNPRISQETRERIQQIAGEMGYQPNYTAQNLTRGEANMVGLIFPVTEDTAPANPFHIDLMRGIGAELQMLSYEMVVAIASSQKKLLEEVKSMVAQSKIHNFLIFYVSDKDPVTEYLRDNQLNFVVIGHPVEGSSDRFVDNDNIAAGKGATTALLNNHRVKNPVFIENLNPWRYEIERSKGYHEGMIAKGKNSRIWKVIPGESSLSDLLQQAPEVDGLIFSDDLLFVQFSAELRDKKLPIACFNNSRLMGMLTKSDEKVDLQPRKLGKHAVDLLFAPDQHHQYVEFEIK